MYVCIYIYIYIYINNNSVLGSQPLGTKQDSIGGVLAYGLGSYLGAGGLDCSAWDSAGGLGFRVAFC